MDLRQEEQLAPAVSRETAERLLAVCLCVCGRCTAACVHTRRRLLPVFSRRFSRDTYFVATCRTVRSLFERAGGSNGSDANVIVMQRTPHNHGGMSEAPCLVFFSQK